MPKLDTTVARLGATRVAEFLNPSTIRLLDALDLGTLTSTKLAKLVVQQLGATNLLLDPATRSELIEALPRIDAEHLSRLLQANGANPWSAIASVGFPVGDPATDALFTYFGYPPPREAGRDEGPLPLELVKSDYTLFAHQRVAYRQTLSRLAVPPRRVLLHMPTGAGKTRTAVNVIADFLRDHANEQEVVVWLAHSEELCEQAAQEFSKAWRILGNRDISLFRQFGPHRNDLEQVRGGFLIGSLQLMYSRSLADQTQFLDLARRVRLVVMDEAHQAVAPTYNQLLRLLAPTEQTAILGLSATPGRSWLDAGEDLRLAEFFHRTKVTLEVEGFSNPVDFLQAEGYLARVEYLRLPYAPGEEITLTEAERAAIRQGFDVPDRLILQLGNDQRRNLLLIRNIMAEADRGGKIIVFACSVDHAYLLSDLLRLRGYHAAAITSSTPREKRRQTIGAYRDTDDIQILTNFGVLTAGFDAPRTNVAVIARPTQSVVLYSQMVGRAARGPLVGGNESCRILTVIDDLPGFRDIAEAFTFWDDIWD